MNNPKPKSYEKRCAELAERLMGHLDRFDEASKLDNIEAVSTRLQADLNLADYRFKTRQADHSKWFLYGPLVISLASFVLSGVLAVSSFFQLKQKEQENQASLIRKILSAPPGEGERLLARYTDARLLRIDDAQRRDLMKALATK